MNIVLEKKLGYESPLTEIIEMSGEGIVCSSGEDWTETLGENPGSWGK